MIVTLTLTIDALTCTVMFMFTANCGTPVSPQNGYINSYVSTIEGAKVNITCLNGLEEWNEMITCDDEGNWMPNPTATDICTNDSGNNNIQPFVYSIIIMILYNVYYCRSYVF